MKNLYLYRYSDSFVSVKGYIGQASREETQCLPIVFQKILKGGVPTILKEMSTLWMCCSPLIALRYLRITKFHLSD